MYSFNEGNKSMKSILGGKGANLAEMTSIGLPVPGGFVISTEACQVFNENENELNEEIKTQISKKMIELQTEMGKRFGDPSNPLLVSVRSGAAVSMPGMMDTVLNLGLNDKTVEGFIQKTGNPRFVYDAYRRFIQMFGDVVMGVKHELFEKALERIKEEKGVEIDTDLNENDLRELIENYKSIIQIFFNETKKFYLFSRIGRTWFNF